MKNTAWQKLQTTTPLAQQQLEKSHGRPADNQESIKAAFAPSKKVPVVETQSTEFAKKERGLSK